MHQNIFQLVSVLLLLQCGALTEAAVSAAARSAASAARSSRSRQEAGQFFGIDLNVGGSEEPSDTAPAASSTTFSFPGVLGAIPNAVAAALGVQTQPPEPQQQQQQQHQKPQQQQPPPASAPRKPKPPQKPPQQQPGQKQDGRKPQPGKPQQQKPKQPTKAKQQDPKHSAPGAKQQKQQQQVQPPSSLIARGPPAQQQQQQRHKLYYKKQKSRQPVVASEPSYASTQPGYVPVCEWRSDFNQCQVHRHYYLALQESPKSYIAQTLTAASARGYACAAHTEAASCQESSQGLRCAWNLSGGRAWDNSGCRSYFMAEWTVFSYLINAGVPVAQAATGLGNLDAFSCPGSLTARALACNTAYPMDHQGNYDPNLCAAAAPGCTFQQSSNNCVMSQELTSQLVQLRADDVGRCSAACYLRVLDSCPAKPYAKSGDAASLSAEPDRCWANKGCTWANGACGPDLYSSQLDSWGRKVAAAAETCWREKEAWGCGQAGAAGVMPLASSAIQEALQRSLPGAGQEDAACPV